MNHRRTVCLALAASAVLLGIIVTGPASFAGSPAAVPQSAATAVPMPLYKPDPNTCPRAVPPGGGGGAGRDTIALQDNQAVVLKFDNQGEPVNRAFFTAEGSSITTLAASAIRVFDASRGRLSRAQLLPTGFGDGILSPDGKFLAAVIDENLIDILDLSTGKVARRIAVPRAQAVPGDNTRPVYTLAYSPDGRLIASSRGTVGYVWEAATGREVLRLRPRRIGPARYDRGHAGDIQAFRFTPNGQALLTGGFDGTIRMWDLATGAHLRCYERGEDESYASLDVSPDGRQIAAAQWDAVVVWNALNSRIERQFIARGSDRFSNAQFSPDGQALLARRDDFTVRMWDPRTGMLTGILRHPTYIGPAAFSPNNRRVITSVGSAVWVWDARHRNVARAALAENTVTSGVELARLGYVAGARAKFDQALRLNPDPGVPLLDAAAQDTLCRYGALYGEAEKVMGYCEGATALQPGYPPYLDSRGLARALSGDIAGAIDDFSAVVLQWQFGAPAHGMFEQRQAWLEALRAGKNPFDEATLRALRDE